MPPSLFCEFFSEASLSLSLSLFFGALRAREVIIRRWLSAQERECVYLTLEVYASVLNVSFGFSGNRRGDRTLLTKPYLACQYSARRPCVIFQLDVGSIFFSLSLCIFFFNFCVSIFWVLRVIILDVCITVNV